MTIDEAIDQIYDLVGKHIGALNYETKKLLIDIADKFKAQGDKELAQRFRRAALYDPIGINDENNIGERIEGKVS